MNSKLLGILLVAKHRGLIPAVKPVIDDLMTEAGFRASLQLYTEIWNAAGEYYYHKNFMFTHYS
ncbi:DUF3368 domain-containing protein [Nostoc sp. WHI]|uniref:DUF3368 domain-containing protein n=1 Tax=Nostoc sp. WHI TaxID=2650611 RepID=UPI0018C8030D|nr:DUF3368 domain-containing protein [Nostoc sp. WHI]MBG1266451.1 DUF3368 domain-containing protein [Nostoc sp. WHI]